MRWIWIDKIIEFEPQKRMAAIKNVTLAEEYLHDHFAADDQHSAQPVMPASLIIEGMAQTAGILVGSVNNFREKVILAKIAQATLKGDVSPGETIRFDATIERIDDNGASTAGTLTRIRSGEGRSEPIGEINLMFSHVDRNLGGIEFPKENFVFTDNFRTILESAGLEFET